MKRWLMASLAATLLASAALALWPDDSADALSPPTRPALAGRAGAGAGIPAPRPGSTAAADAAGSTRARPALHAPDLATGRQPAPGLPARPADWPAPPAAALAAWQGVAAPPQQPRPPAAAAGRAAAAASSAGSAPGAARLVFHYRWIGQLDDGGTPQALLASVQRSVGVRLGDTLDGRWRLVRGPSGELLAQPLPAGDPLPVPGAPPAALP